MSELENAMNFIDSVKNEMSETPAKPKIEDENESQSEYCEMEIPLRIVGVILAIFLASRGSLFGAAMQFLVIAKVPVSKNVDGADFLIAWHALMLIIYSSHPLAALYHKYNLVESNNTIVTAEIYPNDYLHPLVLVSQTPFDDTFDYVYLIVLVSLTGAMLVMLHATITDMLVRSITQNELARYEPNEIAFHWAMLSSIIAQAALSLTSTFMQTDCSRIFFSNLNKFEVLIMIANYNGIGQRVLPHVHCFYLLAVGSFLFFATSVVEKRSLESDPLTMMMSSPWWGEVRNFSGLFSYSGICAVGIFWCIRLNLNYNSLVFWTVHRRVSEHLSLRDSFPNV